jgi:DNA-binding NtrC family response regulator
VRDSLSGVEGKGVRVGGGVLSSPRPSVPSCLVLDMQLPGLSGLRLQQELAKADVQIPIIFISGHGDIPMSVRAIKAGALEFLPKPFSDEDLLNAIEEGIARYEQLLKRGRNLQDEILTELNFKEIVGKSAALRRVLMLVETVAPTESTVLILGETGTGKELIARAVHTVSLRSKRPFVKLNCAAIPSGLLESELFGHEKGAFTGAVAQRIGRFELANTGTLFLDEVGDIPLELQSKLLRVLQEQEFERLGSTRTLRVNVRLIAATNRNLEQMVADKQFREDLYFRLNVFPIRIPPLRERAGDIPALVRHYVEKYAHRMNKQIETITEQTMAILCRYPWPGNIRELQNFIERAVILTPGSVLHIPVEDLKTASVMPFSTSGTPQDLEREHILQVLREAGSVIGGAKGAAARLGLKRTTLLSKMDRFGISRSTKYETDMNNTDCQVSPQNEVLAGDESWLPRESARIEPATARLWKMTPEQEKTIIEGVLADTRGRVSGPSGAATKLGLPSTTLESRIRSLKINKHRFKFLD